MEIYNYWVDKSERSQEQQNLHEAIMRWKNDDYSEGHLIGEYFNQLTSTIVKICLAKYSSEQRDEVMRVLRQECWDAVNDYEATDDVSIFCYLLIERMKYLIKEEARK